MGAVDGDESTEEGVANLKAISARPTAAVKTGWLLDNSACQPA